MALLNGTAPSPCRSRRRGCLAAVGAPGRCCSNAVCTSAPCSSCADRVTRPPSARWHPPERLVRPVVIFGTGSCDRRLSPSRRSTFQLAFTASSSLRACTSEWTLLCRSGAWLAHRWGVCAVIANPIGRRSARPSYALGCLLYPLPLISSPSPKPGCDPVSRPLFASEFGSGLG